MAHRQTHNTTRTAGSTRRSLLAASMALPFVAGPAWSASGEYPDRPIRLVVPLGPGGVSDIMGRLIAEHAGKLLGQPIVVDNRPGAGGVIGSSVVAQAPADGYNLLLGTIGTLAISPSMTAKMPYDADTAFAPVSLLAGSNFAIIANPALPVRNLPELIAYAKERPGKLNYGSAGNGSTLHLGMELLKSMTGIDIVHVPYKSSGQVTAAVLAGEVQIGMPDLPSTLPFVQADKVRLLALTGPKGEATLPGVRTVAQSGVDGFEIVAWLGLMAPAQTPQPIIDKLNQATVAALNSGPMQQSIAKLVAWPMPSTPQEFSRHLRDERAKWDAVVKRSGVRMS